MESAMDAEALVLAVLDALPRKEVRGRKRLQKLSYFAVQTGTNSDVRFFLHEFGPFSAEVAAATDILSLVGEVSEEEIQIGRAKRYFKLYRLANPAASSEKLPASSRSALKKLNEYSTIEIEIASTLRYFMSKGMDCEGATKKTKELKPSKSEPKIIERAYEALFRVGLHEGRRTDQVPSP
jgi:uncharacterized protein YwgA